MKKIIILLFLILFNLQGCKKSNDSQTNDLKEETFNEFIKKFKSDSEFRLNRIKFPLNGFNSDENIDNNDVYFWEKENWLFYSSDDFKDSDNMDFKEKVILMTDTSMIYRIYKPQSGYEIKYHFKKESKKYYLNFYSYKNI